MKRIILLLSLFLMSNIFAQKVPTVLKTSFSKEALAQKLTDINGKTTTISRIFEKHKGKILVIDLWASWCRDCITAMPKAKELEEKKSASRFHFFIARPQFRSLEKRNGKTQYDYQRKLLVSCRLEK